MVSKIGVSNVALNSQKITNNNKNTEIQKNSVETKESKVETIKKSILNGTYKIDLDKTASKIADTLL